MIIELYVLSNNELKRKARIDWIKRWYFTCRIMNKNQIFYWIPNSGPPSRPSYCTPNILHYTCCNNMLYLIIVHWLWLLFSDANKCSWLNSNIPITYAFNVIFWVILRNVCYAHWRKKLANTSRPYRSTCFSLYLLILKFDTLCTLYTGPCCCFRSDSLHFVTQKSDYRRELTWCPMPRTKRTSLAG